MMELINKARLAKSFVDPTGLGGKHPGAGATLLAGRETAGLPMLVALLPSYEPVNGTELVLFELDIQEALNLARPMFEGHSGRFWMIMGMLQLTRVTMRQNVSRPGDHAKPDVAAEIRRLEEASEDRLLEEITLSVPAQREPELFFGLRDNIIQCPAV